MYVQKLLSNYNVGIKNYDYLKTIPCFDQCTKSWRNPEPNRISETCRYRYRYYPTNVKTQLLPILTQTFKSQGSNLDDQNLDTIIKVTTFIIYNILGILVFTLKTSKIQILQDFWFEGTYRYLYFKVLIIITINVQIFFM